jgi:hypothetical protein
MFYANDKIRDFIQQYLHLSDATVNSQMQQYYETINRLVLNACIDHIEKNNLPEKQEFEILLQDKKAFRSDPKIETELVQFLAKLPSKYPELQNEIQEQIAKIDESLWKDLLDVLDEPAAIRILELMNEDMDAMHRFGEKYLSKPAQTP